MTSARGEETQTRSLIWSPLHQILEAQLRAGDPLLLLISPFIGLEALENILNTAEINPNLKVIVRWQPADLLAGASDLRIFPHLQERGVPLYVNQDIHLKLYVFESNSAFSTSGNLTLKGFGYSDQSNIETGVFVDLTQQDWSKLYELIKFSKQVDAEMYHRLQNYVSNCPRVAELPSPPADLYASDKLFTISSLPATETPDRLVELYFRGSSDKCSADDVRRAAHDFVTFGVPLKLNRSEINERLRNSFCQTAFVAEFVKLLRTEKSLRFGAVNDWIHSMCEDLPLPYRWEIKENTRIFYNWLEHFFPRITWDRPNYSQVIYWRDQ